MACVDWWPAARSDAALTPAGQSREAPNGAARPGDRKGPPGRGGTVQRMTRQRQSVFEELERLDDFRSAQQIFDDLQRQGHRVGLATVYRNLQSLSESGDVDVLRSGDGESLYRLCTGRGHHHHLVCRNCGHTEEISMDAIESWVAEVARSHRYTAVEHSMELFGLCEACTAELGDEGAGSPRSSAAVS